MPKSTQTQHGQSSNLEQNPPDNPNLESREGKGPEEERKGSKVHRLSQGKGFYTPKKKEREKPVLLTADQYMRKAGHDKGISALIMSMYKTEILTFEAWAKKVNALLKKRT